MKKSIYILILILLFLAIPLFFLMMLNIGVSLKYETDFGKCISQTSGVNLCQQLNILRGFFFGSIIFFIILLLYRKRIIKTSN